jgi:lysozyme
LPIACDAELLDASPAVVAACMLAFCREVADSTGRLPILYSYPSFLEGLPLAAEMADYPLWIAHYKVTKPRVPRPWKDWLLWQYDGDGGERLPSGVDADFNCYRGTKEQLRQVLGIAG